MRIFLSWYNTFENKKRTSAAVAGIAFSVILIFMQLGFLKTARITSTRLYDYLDFDLIITSDKYEYMDDPDSFDRVHLIQARVVPGVGKIGMINLSGAAWMDQETEISSSCLLISIDRDPSFLSNEEISANLDKITTKTNTVMLDRLSHPELGPVEIGRTALINGFEVEVTSLFEIGLGFFADGSIIVSNETFQNLVRQDSRKVSLGMVKLAPGADLEEVKEAMRASMPSEVLIFGRDEFVTGEQDYFISVKPVGIMFQMGVLVAFIVGAVILYQVLSKEIATKIKEYATLKAMGFKTSTIYIVGFQQALILAIMSYLPALVVSHGVFYAARRASRLPMYLNNDLALLVLVLTLGMCVISGVLALRRIQLADPAELF
jgi:putative ABC transport system permease protein